MIEKKNQIKIIFSLALPFFIGCAALVWKQEFRQSAPIQGIFVEVPYYNSTLWYVKIKNNTDQPINLLLNESSYVGTEGKTERLIRGQTKTIHSDLTQPPITIPPQAMLEQSLTRESWAGTGLIDLMHYKGPANADKLAKLYLMFEIDGQKKPYIIDIKFHK